MKLEGTWAITSDLPIIVTAAIRDYQPDTRRCFIIYFAEISRCHISPVSRIYLELNSFFCCIPWMGSGQELEKKPNTSFTECISKRIRGQGVVESFPVIASLPPFGKGSIHFSQSPIPCATPPCYFHSTSHPPHPCSFSFLPYMPQSRGRVLSHLQTTGKKIKSHHTKMDVTQKHQRINR